MKNLFKSSNLHKVRDVTQVRPLTEEEKKEEMASRLEETKVVQNEPPAKAGKTVAGQQPKNDSAMNSYKSPNADKFVPNCVSIRTSPLETMQDLLDFIRYSASLRDANHFSVIFDD